MNKLATTSTAKPAINLSDLDSIELIFKRLTSCADFTGFPADAMTMEVERIKATVLALELNASAGVKLTDAFLSNAMNGISSQLDQLGALLQIAADRYNALLTELEQLKGGAQ